jgi:hypothetical protein
VFFGTSQIARRVIFQAIEDAASWETDIQEDAIRWIRSEAFDEACMEAELDSAMMKKFIVQVMKLPIGIRRKKAKEMLKKYLG